VSFRRAFAIMGPMRRFDLVGSDGASNSALTDELHRHVARGYEWVCRFRQL